MDITASAIRVIWAQSVIKVSLARIYQKKLLKIRIISSLKFLKLKVKLIFDSFILQLISVIETLALQMLHALMISPITFVHAHLAITEINVIKEVSK